MTAALRAQWETLDNPARIQALAERHLAIKPLDAAQVDGLDHLPEHPQPPTSAEGPDPIAAIIEGDNAFPTADSGPPAAQ